MRCTHYMKYEIIRNASEITFNQYCRNLNNLNSYGNLSDENIVNASILALEKKLSIDRIEVNDELRRKLIQKARTMFHAKVLNYTSKGVK